MTGFPTQAYQMSLTGRQLSPSSPASPTLPTFATYAELATTSAEDGDLGLVASGTAGQPRLYRYAVDTWIPDEPAVWTIATTGAGVMSGLIDAAGAAVYPGDLGVDGNATVYYAVGAAGRCAFVPRALTGGIILGETHTATLAGLLYREDPATAADVSGYNAPGASSISYDSGTGKITMQTSASDTPFVVVGDSQPSADFLYGALLDAVWTGTNPGFSGNGIVGLRYGNTSPYPRSRLLARADGEYDLAQTSAVGIPGADTTVEHDIIMLGDGTSFVDGYYNSPPPAQDKAVPVVSRSFSESPATTGGAPLLAIFPIAHASLPSVTFSGAFAVSITAIP